MSTNGTTLQGDGDAETIPQLRHRRSGKLASIREDSIAAALPHPLRRNSSILSESSYGDARQSFRSSTDDLLLPQAGGEEEELHQDPSLWYSLPLLIAILPAIGGIAFKQGAVIITDLILLILTAFFLHYCLVAPWIWYHSAQTIRLTKSTVVDNVAEDDDAVESREWTAGSPSEQTTDEGSPTGEERQSKDRDSDFDRDAALNELKRHEIIAFGACFVGPLLGAYILHTIRSSLSHFGGDLVSNLHLTLFVLGAEIRPLRRLMKMVQGRTIYLQRLVREDPHMPTKVDPDRMHDIGKRLDELETAVADGKAQNGTASSSSAAGVLESVQKTQKVLQSQIDALNRAVRRYEKRATAQSMQTESRLQDLESRLKDALSLAAAAANNSQKPGMVHMALSSVKSLVLLPLDAIYAGVTYPARLLGAAFLSVLVRLGMVQTARRQPQSSKQSAYTRAPRERPPVKTVKK